MCLQTVTHPNTNQATHGQESNSQPVNHKSDTLTTTLPNLFGRQGNSRVLLTRKNQFYKQYFDKFAHWYLCYYFKYVYITFNKMLEAYLDV